MGVSLLTSENKLTAQMTAASSNSSSSASSGWQQDGQLCRGSGYGKGVSASSAAAVAAAVIQQLPFCHVPPFASLDQRAKIESAKRFVTELNIRAVITRQASLQMQQQQPMAQVQQSTKPARQPISMLCRIYVGNIGYDVDEEAIRVAFLPFGAIKAVEMGWDATRTKHKGFAFVEYELPEAAAMAIVGMNGAPLGQRSIRVSRPNNVTDATQVIDEMIKESNLQNWLYVSNVRRDLSEGDLRLVFAAFGSVLECALAPLTEAEAGSADKHRGFGYIQYETAQEATDSMKNMKMFDLGGQQLRVGRAATPPEKSVPRLMQKPPPPPPLSSDADKKSVAICESNEFSNAESVAQGNGDNGS